LLSDLGKLQVWGEYRQQTKLGAGAQVLMGAAASNDENPIQEVIQVGRRITRREGGVIPRKTGTLDL
jgi:hypothetical protein